jgi:glycosyltransferase involved in cell wall biosynthesis
VDYFYYLMHQKKILWLCSWYPGKTEPFNGDFIQRQAMAAALYNDIYVIHAAGDASGLIKKTIIEINKQGNLTEQIIYFKRSSSAPGRFIAHYRLLILYRKAIRKYVDEYGKPDLVHVHIPVKAGILGLWMKRKFGIPYVVTEHWGIYNDVEKLNYAGKSRGFKYYTKKIFSNAAKFISVSRYLAEGVNRMVLKKGYEILPNVANTGLFSYKEKKNPVFRFIHVSNMVPLKNAEGILRAFKLFAEKAGNVQLVIVGDTDPAIRHYAAGLGLSDKNVFFHGEVPYEQVATEMKQSDCLVLFSNIENSPCVISEAFCCGLPVIGTDVGGIPELINESNGILIEPKDEAALATAMLKMMNGYLNYNHKKIAEDAQNKFSYDIIGKKMGEIYDAVLSETSNL